MKHTIIGLDARYTVSKEYCGYPIAMFVARFCDCFIGAYKTLEEAQEACRKHNNERTV
jgi:hypothetical protein